LALKGGHTVLHTVKIVSVNDGENEFIKSDPADRALEAQPRRRGLQPPPDDAAPEEDPDTAGMDVLIIIIWGRCNDHNFLRFSAKKWAFFSKTNVMIHFLHNLALF
jgi:hypothetical protein